MRTLRTSPHRPGPRPLTPLGLALALAVCLAAVLAVLLLLARDARGVGPPERGDSPTVGEAPGGAPESALQRARAAADALTKSLMGKLMSEMSEGGPGAAIRVCSEVAQEIAAEHSKDGTTIRRVSRKVRNPADRPDAFEAERLEHLARLHTRGELPDEVFEVVDAEDGRRALRYLRPITVKPLCLRCHGDPTGFPPEVRRVLAERYPEDQATGYEAGDLRGAVSVRVPLE